VGSSTTPGHKLELHFTAPPSTSKVGSHAGNTPKVLGIGALSMRDNVLFLPRNAFRGEMLRLKFPLVT
jgi:hypothetical protein